MADPTIQTFCCHHSNDSDMAVKIMKAFDTDSYNAVCITSSILGMLGAIYQILPREQSSAAHRWLTYSAIRGRRIIIWLAVADFLASLGIFARSTIWLNYRNIMPAMNDNSSVLFCAISSAWSQYFYTVTWIWTLCYAIDMRLILRDRAEKMSFYHSFCWTIPAILTASGLSLLYWPDANCHTATNMYTALIRIMPNYIATYLPITIVMIANPVLYCSSMKDMESLLTNTLGQFTRRERHVLDTIKIKFALTNIVFYICWVPNLVNGVLIWSLWFNLPVRITISVWYIMAVLNPLQAFFNSFVYRRWTIGTEKIILPFKKVRITNPASLYSPMISSTSSAPGIAKEENLPLLRSMPRASINRLSCSSYNENL